jgi:hypothetical protein
VRYLKNKNMKVLIMTEPIRTRSGRVSKPPERFSPVENVTDDYSDGDYDDLDDEYDDDDESDESEEESDEESDDESDADENGNLKDFVVDDDEESDDDTEEKA